MGAVVAANKTVLLAFGLVLAACGEIAQEAPKPFAGKDETRSYAGAPFDGDKALYESTLAKRAQTQNEYLSMEAPEPARTPLPKRVADER